MLMTDGTMLATPAPRPAGADRAPRRGPGGRVTPAEAARLFSGDLAALRRAAGRASVVAPPAATRLVIAGAAEALAPAYGFRGGAPDDLARLPSVAETLRHPPERAAAFELVAGDRAGLPVTFFVAAIAALRARFAAARIAGLSADDLWYWSVVTHEPVASVATRLRAAGLDALGGWMAPVGPDAPPFTEWLAAHVAAHRAGLPSAAAPRFADCANPAAVVARLRALRAAPGGFLAITPVPGPWDAERLALLARLTLA